MQNWGKTSESVSTVEDEEAMKAPLLAQRTKAENASLSWAVLRHPDAEFYIEAYTCQLKFYMEEEHANISIKHPA
jgi:hypothetical protein